MTAPSKATQRKPLGEINRVVSKHQGGASEPLKPKLSVSDGRVETKPQIQGQSALRPRSQSKGTDQNKAVQKEKVRCAEGA